MLGQACAGVRSGAATFQTDAIARLCGAVRQMKDPTFVTRTISAKVGVQERSPGSAVDGDRGRLGLDVLGRVRVGMRLVRPGDAEA